MKKISINGAIRQEIIRGVMAAWLEKNPAPYAGTATQINPSFLKDREAHKCRKDHYRSSLSMALSTFKTLQELEDEWPAIMIYVPRAITHPVETVVLP